MQSQKSDGGPCVEGSSTAELLVEYDSLKSKGCLNSWFRV